MGLATAMQKRRHDDLFLLIASFNALRIASRKAVLGKRKKPGASAFFANIERELLRLERELLDASYRPGRYVEILIREPKQRLVSAAPFRDRIIHHALCAVIFPLFEPSFIGNTFANRTGKGTHRAIEAYERYRDRHKHVLRADIFRYFPSIDHAVLKAEFRRRIACERTLWLMDTIVDGSNAQEPVDLHFDGDDLFEPYRRRRGLPIGNLTSQFFANLYLDRFDHWVTEVLRAPYVRYVDDFALFHDDPTVLAEWRIRIEQYLVGRRLKLHPRKTIVLPTAEPSQFLGFVLLPDGGRWLPEDNVARFPGGVTTLYAMTRLEVLVWAGLDASADGLRLQAFLDEFPKGANSDRARVRLAELRTEEAKAKSEAERRAKETDAWGAVAAETDVATIEAFLKAWPKGQHAAAAKTRIAELKRGSGARGQWMLQGAAVTMGAVVLAAAGWWGVEQWRWRATPLDHVAQAGESFSECGHCPVMVVLPAGAVAMGSTDGASDEKPPHQVTIAKAVAVGKYTVTFDEWDACVTAGACDHYHPDDQSWGRGTRPVINVSWDKAKSYVAWLSAKTGRGYRLLSEAEWEYAARAGATTKYYWGDDVGKGNANCSGCGSQWDGKQTAPVGSFQPNAFGLYDMLGNVWQWCEDTRQSDYQGAPTDGSAWIISGVSSRVLRGGSWGDGPQDLRSASRDYGQPDYRNYSVGFRIARTL